MRASKCPYWPIASVLSLNFFKRQSMCQMACVILVHRCRVHQIGRGLALLKFFVLYWKHTVSPHTFNWNIGINPLTLGPPDAYACIHVWKVALSCARRSASTCFAVLHVWAARAKVNKWGTHVWTWGTHAIVTITFESCIHPHLNEKFYIQGPSLSQTDILCLELTANFYWLNILGKNDWIDFRIPECLICSDRISQVTILWV